MKKNKFLSYYKTPFKERHRYMCTETYLAVYRTPCSAPSIELYTDLHHTFLGYIRRENKSNLG